MKIKWGFCLTSLTILSVVSVASELRSQQPGSAGETPLAAAASYGWSADSPGGAGVQRTSAFTPGAPPTADWPTAAGGYGHPGPALGQGLPQGMMPQGMMPQGMMPQGMMPQGMMPQGMMPQGMMPQGMMPQGMMPQGMMPQGMMPQGMMPGGMMPGPYAVPANFSQVPETPEPFPQPPMAPMDMGMPMNPGMGMPMDPGMGMPMDPGMGMPMDMGMGMPMDPGMSGYSDGGLEIGCDCGGVGCERCGGSFFQGVLRRIAEGIMPYTEGGVCAPRWYDITMDAMYLQRDEVSRRVDFASNGINGNRVLSTEDLGFQEELGYRFTGAWQLFPGTTTEFTYFGLFNWATGRAITRADRGGFFSVYSNFGLNPINGFDQTDRSTFQQITYSSTIDNFELNFRRRWSGPNCTVQGSLLAGVRYIYLLEDFEYDTSGGDDLTTPAVIEITGRQNTDVRTRNSLTGLQIGGDLWTTITPGITIGGEIKAGVLGLYGSQTTTALFQLTPPAGNVPFNEQVNINDIAFVTEARLETIYRLGPHWSIRGGYAFLYLDGVALAAENFNPSAPAGVPGAGARTARKNDNGSVFYHGGTLGVEFMW